MVVFGFDEYGNPECSIVGAQRTDGKGRGLFDALVGNAEVGGLIFSQKIFDEQRGLRLAVEVLRAQQVDLYG